MNLLSLFNGIDGARLACERAEIQIDNCYVSEIDKYANIISNKNYPDNIFLGDVTNWENWDLPKIDILIGGSPCQGFSFAGKQLNFEDTRSKLFFKFVDILKYYKPKYFLLENVKMKKESEEVITKLLGVSPVMINSSLLSAQNRRRLYWTNIPNITQPINKEIYLKHIWNGGEDITERMAKKKEGTLAHHNAFRFVRTLEDKSRTLMAGGQNISNSGATNIKIDDRYYKIDVITSERLQTYPDNWTEGISNTQRYKALGNSFTVDVIAHILSHIENPRGFFHQESLL